jgi:hypothetical protein
VPTLRAALFADLSVVPDAVDVYGVPLNAAAGRDPRAFYVLASWAVSGFVLIVWNAWVLMSEVGN